MLNTLKDLPKSTVSQIAEAINISEIAIKAILDNYIGAGIVEGFGNYQNLDMRFAEAEQATGYAGGLTEKNNIIFYPACG